MGNQHTSFHNHRECVRIPSLNFFPPLPDSRAVGSSAPTTITSDITKTFHVPREVSYLVTTLFLLGYVTGVCPNIPLFILFNLLQPLLWGPSSELVGRRPIFLLTLSCYTLLYLGQALAKNIETFLITRFFGGFFAIGPQTVCGGLIADIWSALGRLVD
jgi:MFS transporter, DHA1 family, multidrug resistance protein